jgi:hypothetical protein
MIFGFIYGLPPCLPCTFSPWAVAWLERRMTGFFFCDFFWRKTHARRGPDLQSIFCPTADVLELLGKSFLFFLAVPVM